MTKRTPVGSASPQKRIPINVLCGLPDDKTARVRVVDDGARLEYVGLGSARIAPYVSKRFLLDMTYLHAGDEWTVKLGPGALLNHAADADVCKESLQLIERVVLRARRPCFNHPAAIARTARDEVSRILSGIPGLKVPKTIRIHAASPAAVGEAIAKHELGYPVLVGMVGSQGGKNMVLVMEPATIAGVAPLIDEPRALYVTEYHDFVSSDGLYRKFRVVVVGDEIFLRTCIIGKRWLLNRDSRHPGSKEEERRQLASFDAQWVPRLKPVFLEVGRRLDLDFFGVDCSIDAEGRVLLFEANARMNILRNSEPSPNIWDAPIARIKAAVEDLLASPMKWRDFKRYAESTSAHGSSSLRVSP